MITEEDLEKLYYAVIDDEILTNEKLINYGFDETTIYTLIKNKIIRKKENKYEFVNLNSLYFFRQKLLAKNEIVVADKCLSKCIDNLKYTHTESFSNIAKLIYQKNYDAVIQNYETLISTKAKLKKRNYYILFLLSVLVDLPERYNLLLNDLNVENYLASFNGSELTTIKNKIVLYSLHKEFDKALGMLKDYLGKRKIINSQILIYELLLEDIVVKQNELKDNKIKMMDDNFEKIIFALLDKDIDSAFQYVKEYLFHLDKTDYEFIVLSLINLSIETKDLSFTLVIKTLNSISSNNWRIGEFINGYQKYLNEYNLPIAKLYKDVLIALQNIQGLNIDSESLESSYQNAVDFVQKNTLSDIEMMNEETKIKKYCQIVACEQGILMLPICNKLECQRIKEIVRKYPDVSYMTFSEGNDKQVVLKYMPEQSEVINYTKLVTEGKKAYYRGNYEHCISCFKTITQLNKKPRAFEYVMLGFAYLKSNKIESALEYLRFVNYLNIRYGEMQYDIKALLETLEGKISVSEDAFAEKYSVVSMTVEDFELQNNQFNDIPNLEEITNYILETGLTVGNALKQKGLNDEQINQILIIYAKEFYLKGSTAKGDEFVKCVERISNKSDEIKALLREVVANKKLYLKKGGATLSLSLRLKP